VREICIHKCAAASTYKAGRGGGGREVTYLLGVPVKEEVLLCDSPTFSHPPTYSLSFAGFAGGATTTCPVLSVRSATPPWVSRISSLPSARASDKGRALFLSLMCSCSSISSSSSYCSSSCCGSKGDSLSGFLVIPVESFCLPASKSSPTVSLALSAFSAAVCEN